MSIVLSPSSFWWFMQCPYKRKNSIYDADPRNTAHWSLANAAAAAAISWTDNKLWPRLRYYDNYINPKLEPKKRISIDALKSWMWKLYKFFTKYTTKDYQIRQEQKFEYPWENPEETEDVWISWQPDVFVLYNNPSREDKIVAEIIDIKCWKISWYSKPDIRRENAQWYFYPWFIFQHFRQEINFHWIDKPKIKFSFAVIDKWTWDLETFSKELDENITNIQMKEHMKQFRDLQKQNLDKQDYPATKCRWCAFCEFADTCPLKSAWIDVTQSELDDLF